MSGLPWVRLDTSFPHNPKLLSLLGDKDGYRAALVYVCGLAYSGAQGSDGFIPGAALPFIHGRKADAELLVLHDFWHPDRGGWLIKDWDEFQQSTDETQARRKRAQEASAKANCIRWHGKDCGCWMSGPDSGPDSGPESQNGFWFGTPTNVRTN